MLTTFCLLYIANFDCTIYFQVPMQANGHDCGLFVTRYAEMVLKRLPSSSASILQNKFLTELPSNEFSQSDVDKERVNLLKLIDR